jgi:ABC-2 type transport system permease protein
MRPFWALVRKQFVESRWSLTLSAAALFGLGWLFVYVTALNEAEILTQLGSDEGGGGRIQWLRNMGIGETPSSAALIMASWNHPFILLLISSWSIGRGAAAVAAEVERGTMDLILSRPVSRSEFLASQVTVAATGLAILGLALFAGASIAVHYNVLREPPSTGEFFRPALNLIALGLPIYGYTLLASSVDHVGKRPIFVGAVLTLGGFIAWVISMIPVLSNTRWKPWLERVSIFKAYNPIEIVTTGESLAFNVSILAGVGAACVALAFVAFAVRDLPTNG